MKRVFIFFMVITAIIISSCRKDDINEDNSTVVVDDEAITSVDDTVSIVFSKSGSATVSGIDDSYVTISGNDVTINYTDSSTLYYQITGETSDGFFKLYSSKKQIISLTDVSITNPTGAAINIQSGKRIELVVNGTNSLVDGSSYSDATSSEDMKAALFSEGQLIFNGTGSLTVKATGNSGIVSDDYLLFNGPDITVSSTVGNGVKANDYVIVADGTLDITVSAAAKKGISSDGAVSITGGTTTITVTGATALDSDSNEYKGSAGIKSDGVFTIEDGTLTIVNSGEGGKGITGDGEGYFKGGAVSVSVTGSNYGSSGDSGSGGMMPGQQSSSSSSSSSVSAKGVKFDGNLYFSGSDVTVSAYAHEAIESKGTIDITGGEIYAYSQSDDAINASSTFTIDDGYVFGYSADNDGMDANGNFIINGGVVYAIGASSPEVAFDANTESGYALYINGGTVIAVGGLENGASLSQPTLSSSWSTNTTYALLDTDGKSPLFAFKTPSTGGSSLVLSASSLKEGSSYTLSSGVTVSGGEKHFDGMYIENPSVSGGNSSTITASTTSSTSTSGGGPGGGTPPSGK